MGKDIRGLNSIKTLMGMKHRSLPKAERANDAEIYLLRNNLALSTKELVSIKERKQSVENRISDIEARIAELEAQEQEKKAEMSERGGLKKILPRGKMKVLPIDY